MKMYILQTKCHFWAHLNCDYVGKQKTAAANLHFRYWSIQWSINLFMFEFRKRLKVEKWQVDSATVSSLEVRLSSWSITPDYKQRIWTLRSGISSVFRFSLLVPLTVCSSTCLCACSVASWTRSVQCIDISIDQLSGLSLLGPINSTPSIGMSFSLMAFCTHRWYFRKVSVHGSPLRSPFRNFSANQRLKHWSYSCFRSVQASPTLFISDSDLKHDDETKYGGFLQLFSRAGAASVTFPQPRDAIGWLRRRTL